MQAFWMKLDDGRSVCCEGQTGYDARMIVEKLTGKAVAGCTQWKAEGVKQLPYPASPIIWQLDHPVNGKTPPFCYQPDKCCNANRCMAPRSCVD